MKKVYWFDEHSSSKYNGIGTYRNILLPRLGADDNIDLTLVSLNSDGLDLTFTSNDIYNEIVIPSIAGGDWEENGALILPALKQYIRDDLNNVFMLNHSPCNKFAAIIKELFPLSKLTFTIHDQAWCSALWGSYNLLRQILVDRKEPDGLDKGIIDYVKKRARKDREMYDMVDAVICLSESTHKVLTEVYGVIEGKVHTIPNGYKGSVTTLLDRSVVRQKLGFREDEIVILFVGRPSANKGIMPILSSIKQVLNVHPNIKCVFTGTPGGLSSFWKFAADIAAHIICIGQVPHDSLRQWYKAADVGIIASYSEQCSYAALEMMEYGLTIVASDGNGVRDMFIDGKNAFVAEIGNVLDSRPFVNNLTDAINRALSATIMTKQRFADNNTRLLHRSYSPERMTAGYVNLLTVL